MNNKGLISLRGFADWSAPLLFANPRRQVSGVEAHMSVLNKTDQADYPMLT